MARVSVPSFSFLWLWVGRGIYQLAVVLRMALGPFGAVGRGGLMGIDQVESSARAPCLPRFILRGSFSDTLIVVSILDIFSKVVN